MARNFGPRRFGMSSAFMLRRIAQKRSDAVHEFRMPTADIGLVVSQNIRAGLPRVDNLPGEKILHIAASADADTDSPSLEHGTTQQHPTAPEQPAQTSEPATSPPAVTPAQAAAAARIRVAADRKNGRKTDDWIVELAHGA